MESSRAVFCGGDVVAGVVGAAIGCCGSSMRLV
jgi:hypothetical protein